MLGRTRLGLIPLGEEGEPRITAFVRALGDALGEPIDLHRAADYRALASAVEQGLVHLAWLPPLAAARAVRTGAVSPVALAVRSGATSYYAGLITQESSRIRAVTDLKGLRAAWVDRESASGFVVIRAALRGQGVNLCDAFAEDLFVRSHAEVARAVDSGRADVGATCFNFIRGAVELARSTYAGINGDPIGRVRLVAQAGPIPSDIFAVHRSMNAAMIGKLQTAFVGARPAALYEAAKEMMFADSFAAPESDHTRMLDALYEMVHPEGLRSGIPPRSFTPFPR